MPPNRKGNFDAVDTALLNVSQFVETSKFQPLTGAATPATTQSKDAPVVVKAAEPQQQQHYDDPAIQAIIDRIVLEERLREQFSVDHILQTEQQQQARDKANVHQEDTKSDDYWAMTTPTDLSDEVRSKQTNASYWDWPTQTKQQKKDDLVSAIVEQERVRQLFTVDHVLLKIKEQAATLSQKETLPQNDGYWAWDGKVALNDSAMEADKDDIIQHILEAEKLRQQFSVAALEEKLIQEQKVSEEDVSHMVAANDDYWAGF